VTLTARHVGSEFRQAGILSPLSTGGTPVVLQITTDDADTLWQQRRPDRC
jgi:hypothetical protein